MSAVRRHLDGVVVLSTLAAPADGLRLDRSCRATTTATPRDPSAGGSLHWAPLRHPGYGRAWPQRRPRGSNATRPDAVVVGRLGRDRRARASARRSGRRSWPSGASVTTPPHALAYAQAAAIAAPWTAATHLPGEGPPEGLLCFTGAISRFDDELPGAPRTPGGDVLVLVGAGGHDCAAEDVARSREVDARSPWHVAGALRRRRRPTSSTTGRGRRCRRSSGVLRRRRHGRVEHRRGGRSGAAAVRVPVRRRARSGSRHVRPRRCAGSASRPCGPGGRARRRGRGCSPRPRRDRRTGGRRCTTAGARRGSPTSFARWPARDDA